MYLRYYQINSCLLLLNLIYSEWLGGDMADGI